jgi:hypothetical protein
MSNRLTLTRAFESSGMPNDDADRAASAIYDAVRDDVATKADLRELEQRLEIRLEKSNSSSPEWLPVCASI